MTDTMLLCALKVLIKGYAEHLFAENGVSPEEAALVMDGVGIHFIRRAHDSVIGSMASCAPEKPAGQDKDGEDRREDQA